MSCIYDILTECLGGCPNCPRKDLNSEIDPEELKLYFSE